jgi:hypothetical protein
LSTAASALLLVLNEHHLPQLLSLASITCNLGSAIASTTLLSSFESVRSLRLAWFEGRAWFVFALSAPSGWLRWGVVLFLSALLSFIWISQSIGAKVLGTVLVGTQVFLFFVLPLIGQTFRFWGAVQLFTSSLPLAPDDFRLDDPTQLFSYVTLCEQHGHHGIIYSTHHFFFFKLSLTCNPHHRFARVQKLHNI